MSWTPRKKDQARQETQMVEPWNNCLQNSSTSYKVSNRNAIYAHDMKKKEEEMEGCVPVIDLHDFPVHFEKLREAGEEWGCFRVLNHNVPPALMAGMKSVVKCLFDLPVKIKKCNTPTVIAGSGYIAPSQINPLYEAFGLYDMGAPQALSDFCSKLDASTYQREVIEKYGTAVNDLAMDIARKLAESIGLVGDFFKDWPCQFRINKYNFTPQTVGTSGVRLHTDSGFLTVLQDDENVPGLEAMTKSGAFVAVDPLPGTLFINLGDVAHAWSNGRLHNVKHRVECKEASVRLSIATFLLGPKEAVVEAPEELVDLEHPRLYHPFTIQESRNLRLSTKLQAGEALELFRIDALSP